MSIQKHHVQLEASLIYRNTKDYIRRVLDDVGGMSFASYENHGNVITKGYNLSARYTFSKWITLEGTFNNLNARDNERYVASNSAQESLTYKERMPSRIYLRMQMRLSRGQTS